MTRILVVDDEPVIVSVLQSILALPGRQFATAASAAQALEVARGLDSLEVALLDKNLPDRNGLELAHALRELHPDVEVIFMTGYASLESAVEAIHLGAFAYVLKPFEDFDDLALKVAQAADRVRERREQRRRLEDDAAFRAIFETFGDAILLLDEDSGEVHDANPAAARLYGYEREELRRTRVANLQASAVPAADSASQRESVRHQRKDGSVFEAEVHQGELQLPERTLRIMRVRDRADRERQEKRQVLETRLVHAQQLDAINQAAGGVAHDFSNLLTVILGNGQVLLSRLDETDARANQVRGIVHAGERVAELVKRLRHLGAPLRDAPQP
jgi:two-component system cell cycle sensor histidine kinase/response regulator CckA